MVHLSRFVATTMWKFRLCTHPLKTEHPHERNKQCRVTKQTEPVGESGRVLCFDQNYMRIW